MKVNDALKTLENYVGLKLGSGQCYAVPALITNLTGQSSLGGGIDIPKPSRVGGGMSAKDIWRDYSFKNAKIFIPNQYSDLKPGQIICIKAGANLYDNVYTDGVHGHVFVVKELKHGLIYMYEQNWLDIYGRLNETVRITVYADVPQFYSNISGLVELNDMTTYNVNVNILNVRNKPSLNSSKMAFYTRDKKVNIDYTTFDKHANILWGHYTSFTGQDRYIAIRDYNLDYEYMSEV